MLKQVFVVFLLLGISNEGLADIMDRIDRCEYQGGGSCLFSILRELASGSGSSDSREPILYSGLDCTGPEVARLKRTSDCNDKTIPSTIVSALVRGVCYKTARNYYYNSCQKYKAAENPNAKAIYDDKGCLSKDLLAFFDENSSCQAIHDAVMTWANSAQVRTECVPYSSEHVVTVCKQHQH